MLVQQALGVLAAMLLTAVLPISFRGGAAISACEKSPSSVLVKSCRHQCLCSRPCEKGLQGQQALGQQWRQALAVLAAMQLTAVLPMSFRGCRYQCL